MEPERGADTPGSALWAEWNDGVWSGPGADIAAAAPPPSGYLPGPVAEVVAIAADIGAVVVTDPLPEAPPPHDGEVVY